jgi:hypothetical protein
MTTDPTAEAILAHMERTLTGWVSKRGAINRDRAAASVEQLYATLGLGRPRVEFYGPEHPLADPSQRRTVEDLILPSRMTPALKASREAILKLQRERLPRGPMYPQPTAQWRELLKSIDFDDHFAAARKRLPC